MLSFAYQGATCVVMGAEGGASGRGGSEKGAHGWGGGAVNSQHGTGV